MGSKDGETRSTDEEAREGEAPAEPNDGKGPKFGRSLTLPWSCKKRRRTPTARIAIHKKHAKSVLRSVMRCSANPPKTGPQRVERPSL